MPSTTGWAEFGEELPLETCDQAEADELLPEEVAEARGGGWVRSEMQVQTGAEQVDPERFGMTATDQLPGRKTYVAMATLEVGEHLHAANGRGESCWRAKR